MLKKSSVTSDRDKYIGGSDIGAVCNLNIYANQNAESLYEKKHSGETDDLSNNIFVQFGNQNEYKVREAINQHYQTNFIEDTFIKDDLRGNTDGVNDDTILEIKCRVSKGKILLSDVLQAHMYCLLSGKRKIMIAIAYCNEYYELGDEIIVYHFEYSHKLVRKMKEYIEAFREKNFEKENLVWDLTTILKKVEVVRLKTC